MANPDVNYKSLNEGGNPFRKDENLADIDSPNENEDTPRTSGIMIHIVPETSRTRWNHIEDLDSFFTRMYNYHQKHGFTVIVMDGMFQLIQFGFVVWVLTFTVYCVDYKELFGDAGRNKTSISDVTKPIGECVQGFTGITFLVLFIATLFFMVKMIKMIYHITQYSDMKKFYNSALQIEDNELDNITWHEIKKKIREVQSEQHMCIDKEQLTELDIYHRILRFKNYMVALMNKNLLPVRFRIPILGEFVSLSRGLTYNIDFILFRGPGSPFQNNWQLRDDYTQRSNQVELAQRLSKQIMWVAIANLILAPVIFLWQCIYFSFQYVNILKKEPGALGMRTWSNYGRLYLRHFNELEHELDARLNRAYEPADRYLSSFSSPIMNVIAKNILFLSGGILFLILALGIYDEYVFQVEHVLTIIAVLTGIGVVCRTLIPDENRIWCPEQLLTAVLAHVHYLPSEWKCFAHTTQVQQEFGHFFQFKAAHLLNEICSPLITPFILLFVFRPKALEIVKFFRSFTVTVKGVGNVCSFAQMDVRKHGNPEWQLLNVNKEKIPAEDEGQHYAVENGKTELSLVHFTLTNPEWRMPPDAKHFMKGIRKNAIQDLMRAKTSELENNTAMAESLVSFGTIGEEYSSVANSIFNNHHIVGSVIGRSVHPIRKPTPMAGPSSAAAAAAAADSSTRTFDFEQMLQQNLEDASTTTEQENDDFSPSMMQRSTAPMDRSVRFGVRRSEGRPEGPADSLLYSIYGLDSHLGFNPADLTTADMCLSTLYLHEVHRRRMKSRPIRRNLPGRGATTQSVITANVAESTPLLHTHRS
ncbi:autophagy-related protein 9A [Eupeodes corollae]|uniref:autophagy-related protein 9A n=1 Tax=Eupeodes corollae TaxID=290404 RepID=UPI00249057A4|nr:autophagy-related protein 9A [Eupeodes corollae]XP_055912675.1 autophagy-related protein 9A [Eupeodes corollae]